MFESPCSLLVEGRECAQCDSNLTGGLLTFSLSRSPFWAKCLSVTQFWLLGSLPVGCVYIKAQAAPLPSDWVWHPQESQRWQKEKEEYCVLYALTGGR